MRSLRGLARRVGWLVVVVPPVVLGLWALPAAAHGGRAALTTPLASNEGPTPGWKTYTFASAVISAPASWAVERNDPCPSSQAAGLLVLGEPFGVQCPTESTPADMVVVNSIDVAATASPPTQPDQSVQRVHGVAVDIEYDPTAVSNLWAPSLGVSVSWSGLDVRKVVSSLQPLEPKPLSSTCRQTAVRNVLPALAKEIGAAGLPSLSSSPVPPSATTPGVSSDFDTNTPEFTALVTSGLQVFDGLVPDSGTVAFYSSALQPSRRVELATPGCRGQIAGIETLTASVARHLLGPPWQMVAVTEPGWTGGALFFRGNCPGGAEPTTTTAACETASVFFESGSTAPSSATGSTRSTTS
jgi:hypothetical protein